MTQRDEYEVESLIRDNGLTAPRITPAQIDALIADMYIHAYVVPGTTTTVAAAFLPNGFCLGTAISACVDPRNFNAEIGKKIAVDKVTAVARDKLWEVEGYALKKELQAAADRADLK